MLVLHLIFVSLLSLFSFLSAAQEKELPAWTSATPETNLFVIQTQELATHFAATESLLPVTRTEVIQWAEVNLGKDSRSIIESIPLEDFQTLIKDEHVHTFRRQYDAEDTKRFETDHDDFYIGYVQVHIHDSFRDHIEQQLSKLRLKNRLCTVLVTAIFSLGLLAVAWAYLFTSRLTRGFYISRLRWLAGLLIGTLTIICYAVCQMIF